jgi:hypothetical protein
MFLLCALPNRGASRSPIYSPQQKEYHMGLLAILGVVLIVLIVLVLV